MTVIVIVVQIWLLSTGCADAVQVGVCSDEQLIVADRGAGVEHAVVAIDGVESEFFIVWGCF